MFPAIIRQATKTRLFPTVAWLNTPALFRTFSAACEPTQSVSVVQKSFKGGPTAKSMERPRTIPVPTTLSEPEVAQLMKVLVQTLNTLETMPTPSRTQAANTKQSNAGTAKRKVRVKFTEAESERLAKLVQQFGRKWKHVSKLLGGTRCASSLRKHYTRRFEPERLHWEESRMNKYYAETHRQFYEEVSKAEKKIGNFSKREHDIFMGLLRFYGRRWSVMAHVFADKTYDQLRRHDTFYKRRLRRLANATFDVELDIPEGILKGDPNWTFREISEMQKVINHYSQNSPINASKITYSFPGRSNEELNTMLKWVTVDCYIRRLRSKPWTNQELDVLQQFVRKYGRQWSALYASRCIPGRSPKALRKAYATHCQ